MDGLAMGLGNTLRLLDLPGFPGRRSSPRRIGPEGYAAGGFLAGNGIMDRVGRIGHSLGLSPRND